MLFANSERSLLVDSVSIGSYSCHSAATRRFSLSCDHVEHECSLTQPRRQLFLAASMPAQYRTVPSVLTIHRNRTPVTGNHDPERLGVMNFHYICPHKMVRLYLDYRRLAFVQKRRFTLCINIIVSLNSLKLINLFYGALRYRGSGGVGPPQQ